MEANERKKGRRDKVLEPFAYIRVCGIEQKAIFYFRVPIEIHTSNVCVYSGGDDVYLPLLTLNLG